MKLTGVLGFYRGLCLEFGNTSYNLWCSYPSSLGSCALQVILSFYFCFFVVFLVSVAFRFRAQLCFLLGVWNWAGGGGNVGINIFVAPFKCPLCLWGRVYVKELFTHLSSFLAYLPFDLPSSSFSLNSLDILYWSLVGISLLGVLAWGLWCLSFLESTSFFACGAYSGGWTRL